MSMDRPFVDSAPRPAPSVFDEFQRVQTQFQELHHNIEELKLKRQDLGNTLRELSKRLEKEVREALAVEEEANGVHAKEGPREEYR